MEPLQAQVFPGNPCIFPVLSKGQVLSGKGIRAFSVDFPRVFEGIRAFSVHFHVFLLQFSVDFAIGDPCIGVCGLKVVLKIHSLSVDFWQSMHCLWIQVFLGDPCIDCGFSKFF